jgi:hypothetical protein
MNLPTGRLESSGFRGWMRPFPQIRLGWGGVAALKSEGVDFCGQVKPFLASVPCANRRF